MNWEVSLAPTRVYSVEETLALMSDRVSAGAPNGVRIEDDATKLYDEFAGIDLAFVPTVVLAPPMRPQKKLLQ